MHDDDNLCEIFLTDFGVYVRVRKNVLVETPMCPLCDESMERLNKPPMNFQSANHWLNVTNNFEFFACPDRDYTGHRRQEAAFRAACRFWIKPFAELLALSDQELFGCRKIL